MRGPGANKLLNCIPDKLMQEWMDSMVKCRIDHPDQNTIVDLCAGYQSIKQWALNNRFNYIAVDITGTAIFGAAKSPKVRPSSPDSYCDVNTFLKKRGGCQYCLIMRHVTFIFRL